MRKILALAVAAVALAGCTDKAARDYAQSQVDAYNAEVPCQMGACRFDSARVDGSTIVIPAVFTDSAVCLKEVDMGPVKDAARQSARKLFAAAPESDSLQLLIDHNIKVVYRFTDASGNSREVAIPASDLR